MLALPRALISAEPALPVHGAKSGPALELSAVLTLAGSVRGAGSLRSLGPLQCAEPASWEREPPPTPPRPPPEQESYTAPPSLPSPSTPVSRSFGLPGPKDAYYSVSVSVCLVEKSLL